MFMADALWVGATAHSMNRERKMNRMDDTISRQAAIDALEEPCKVPESWTDEYAVGERAQWEKDVKALNSLPSTQPERKAPVSYKEQLSLDCSFCRQHERGDTLYESSDWDGGIGFDYIRNIRFCPICGRELYDEE